MTTNPASHPASPKRVPKMASNKNMNHLLNFTLPPRQTRPSGNLPRRSRKTGTQQGVWKKDRFVNAQYRFVMNPAGDYTAHFADPDIFFQWHDILQVIIPRSSPLVSATSHGGVTGQGEGNTTCPICLSPPTAPRMTKCGHVFCFPCILHYLSISDNKWARCPICSDPIIEGQLKGVKWYDGPVPEGITSVQGPTSFPSPSVNDPFDIIPRADSTLPMRLIQRPKITTLALPRSPTWPSDILPPHQAPFHFLPDVFSFAKFMLATPTYLLSDLSRDLDELNIERRVLADSNDDLGIFFIEGAEQKVRNQMSEAAALETPVLKDRIERTLRDQHKAEKHIYLQEHRVTADEASKLDISEVPQEFLALKSGNVTPVPGPSSESPLKSKPLQNRNIPKQRRNVNPPPPSTSTYYYYQAASGLPLFLHPLDIRILLSYFSTYSSFPDTITLRVEAFAEGTINDDLRKRCKYLGHMPEGADVVFIEADLEGVVGTEGLKNFEGALKMRTARRKEKGRRDDRARMRAEESERERSADSRNDVVFSNSSVFVHDSPSGDFSSSPSEPGTAAPLVPSGAWGVRSFASALHSPTASNHREQHSPLFKVEDWEDVDAAWHELERKAGTRNKRGAKLVVLGSGAGSRRR